MNDISLKQLEIFAAVFHNGDKDFKLLETDIIHRGDRLSGTAKRQENSCENNNTVDFEMQEELWFFSIIKIQVDYYICALPGIF